MTIRSVSLRTSSEPSVFSRRLAKAAHIRDTLPRPNSRSAIFSWHLPSKCRRRVDPQHPGFLAPRILPAVRNRAFKIKTVAGLQPVMLALIQPDFKVAPKNMQEFLALVRVGLAAAAAGLYAEKVRLHRRVAPGKQFHANIRRSFQNFSFGRPH